jgi:hypothetical protein
VLLRLLLGFLAALFVARLLRGLFGPPPAPPGDRSRTRRVRSDLDPRHRVEARWSEIEGEESGRKEGTPED